jgi:hypothetical protein
MVEVGTVRRLCRERDVAVQVVEEGAWVAWPEVAGH